MTPRTPVHQRTVRTYPTKKDDMATTTKKKPAVKAASTPKPTPVALPALQQAFHDTEVSLNDRVIERSDFIHALLLALVGKMDVFGLGEPGVAKTLTVTALRDHISDLPPTGYFWRLLTKFTTPSELFGPPDLKAMDEGIWRLQTQGTMVDANFVILDEIFKANSAILNTLLTFMNEGVFHNDVPIAVPKWTVFGISNELPQGEELNALFDRLDLRCVIERIQTSSGFIQMLKGDSLGPIVPTLTVDQITQAQAEVKEVLIPEDVLDALLVLRNNLAGRGVEPSDRRFARSLQVIRAATWLRGGTFAGIDDMEDLKHALWSTLDERPQVISEVLQLASPLEELAMRLRDDVDKLQDEYDLIWEADNPTEQSNRAMPLHTKIDRAAADLGELQDQLTPGRRSDTMEKMDRQLTSMNHRILRDIFHVDPDSFSPIER